MKKNIAITVGGYSDEAPVSLESARMVTNHPNKEKYTPYLVRIDRGKRVYVDEQNAEYPINRNDFSVAINGQKATFGAVFNVIYGTPGKDGYLQAYFNPIGVPLISCSMYASALTLNKRDILSMLKSFGILSALSYYLNKGENYSTAGIAAKVGLPYPVKPSKTDSSLGASRVNEEAALKEAIDKTPAVDDEILIESFLKGAEISIGVIKYRGVIKALPTAEMVSENDFFGYDTKYNGKSQEITPARISEEMTAKINTSAERVYRLLKMEGFSRSEFVIVEDTPYSLEMNTISGLLEASLLPQQAKVAGISLADLSGSEVERVLNIK